MKRHTGRVSKEMNLLRLPIIIRIREKMLLPRLGHEDVVHGDDVDGGDTLGGEFACGFEVAWDVRAAGSYTGDFVRIFDSF